MQELNAIQLHDWLQKADSPLLVDVREDFEREVFNIGGLHIPLGELNTRITEIATDRPVVFYCARGIRSAIAIQRLEEKGWRNLFNLSGGIHNWKNTFEKKL